MRGLAIGVVGVLVALVAIGVGVLVGNSTNEEPYKQVVNQTMQLYVSGGSSNGYVSYIEFEGDPSIYLVHERDFTPELTFDALQGSTILTVTYIPSNTTSVDITTSSGRELKGTAYQVVAVTAQLATHSLTFQTAEYANDPNGFPQDHWNIGRIIVGGGVVLIIVSIWLAFAANGIIIYPEVS